ncbi:hypothetical protein P7H12_00260 [Paenibacillus larvae]|nr:hypothetical protein [Paenibacillus larvae]MDT2262405.1 hypothetical protein [Paenibacillus larvae]
MHPATKGATDEEVAAAKQEEKWAKIGRKVNEFKVGDIVRYAYKSENSNAIGESGFSGILAEIDKVNPVADSVRLIKPSFVDDSWHLGEAWRTYPHCPRGKSYRPIGGDNHEIQTYAQYTFPDGYLPSKRGGANAKPLGSLKHPKKHSNESARWPLRPSNVCNLMPHLPHSGPER